SETLKTKYEYKVKLLRNATRDEILREFTRYRNELTPNDALLIYYAGHGWLDKEAGRGYWIPVDGGALGDTSNWIANDDITSTAKAMRARHVLVISDSCYSGTLTRGVQGISNKKAETPEDPYIKRMRSKRARIALSSGGLETVSDAGPNDHSVFANALINVLKENKGIMDSNTLFARLRRPVAVNATQTPEYGDIRNAHHDGGDFLFIPKQP
ncbi:hypothetical protein TI03_05700, partial [Achromatium sp. WMS1]